MDMCAARLVDVPEDMQSWAEGREARSEGGASRTVGFVGNVEDIVRRAVCKADCNVFQKLFK
jgi:hypothetical protein